MRQRALLVLKQKGTKMYINYYSTDQNNDNYTFDALFNGTLTVTTPRQKINTLQVGTLRPTAQNKLIQKYNLVNIAQNIKRIIDTLGPQIPTNLAQSYNIFKIPKHSGGLRTISAPTGNLKLLLESLHTTLTNNYYTILPHDCAYAYTKGRDAYKALQRHTTSEWFLKLDIKDFFPSCNKTLLMDKIPNVFPFNIIQDLIPEHFEKMIDFCLLNDELPQGTNMSPLLTNTLMVEFDVKFTAFCENNGLIYTRYADDMLISGKEKFNFIYIQNVAIAMLRELGYNFTIKKEKTRFGSINGSNWNLGLMLNKDHNITIGYRKKKIFKAMLHNFIQENLLTNEQPWSIMDIQHLAGLHSYYKRIEPDYIDYIIQQYNSKYNVDVVSALKI